MPARRLGERPAMTTTTAAKPAPKAPATPAVEGSSYDIIRKRLDDQGQALQQKIEKLNGRRLEVFGGTWLAPISIASHSVTGQASSPQGPK